MNKDTKEYREEFSKKSLAHLRMKNVYLTPKRLRELVGSLTLDDKLLYGAILNEQEDTKQVLQEADIKELDGELTFGKTTFQDGIEIYNNNKY